MILKVIIDMYIGILDVLIGIIPDINIPNWVNNVIDVVGNGLKLFPGDVWVAVISTVILWSGVSVVWSVIEWIYKKIPGIS